ncbi:MAG: CBS domain-containing protein [Chloroflexi bacterium]|nr:CBS domain-containing protein [Chloroflexota bacterium]
MSPRAAARLETLGFDKVYDYVPGKSDWIAAGLPTVRQSPGPPTAGMTLRAGDIVSHLGERLGDAARRARAEGKDEVIVVDDRHVVLGRVRGAALDGGPATLIEDAMRPGPATVRPDTLLETIVASLGGAGVASTLVTDPDGRFIGTVYLEDARGRLGQPRADAAGR